MGASVGRLKNSLDLCLNFSRAQRVVIRCIRSGSRRRVIHLARVMRFELLSAVGMLIKYVG